jgi:3-mercaptopyruvate sulfurtransferase SseA
VTTLTRRAFSLLPLGLVLACRESPSPDRKAPNAEDELGPRLAPSALAARMDDVKSGKIAVFYVGPDALFARGHVPGARKLGAMESPETRRAFEQALAALPQEAEVVVYCGCCPTSSCPNVLPASAAIRATKRARAYVLDLPTRFATDWVDRGYPVERG